MSLSIETYALCKKYCDSHASHLTTDQAIQAVSNYFDENPNSIVTNSELESILENYLTEHQDISGKQDILIAGDNITIAEDGKTISAQQPDLTGYVVESEATPVINNIYDMDEDDTAHANWGGDWRMPTYAEIQELYALTWIYTEEDLGHGVGGRDGFETITANGNSLILPSTGARGGSDGNYVSVISNELDSSNNEMCLSMSAYAELWRGNNTSHNKYDASAYRYMGNYIRPVIAVGGNTNGHTAIDLGLSVLWADRNIGAVDVKDVGTLFAWGETTTKTEFTKTNYKYILDSENSTYSKYVNNTAKGLPDGLTKLTISKFIPRVDIVDNLNSEDQNKVLSAKQGKILKELINNNFITGTDSILATIAGTNTTFSIINGQLVIN